MRQAIGDYDDRSDEFALVGDERGEDYASPSDRRLPTIALTMLVMAVFAGGLWFAYHVGARHSAGGSQGAGLPLIRADRTPDKVKPAQPGGMKIPDQNVSIYNEKPGVAPIENLLPPPEKPLPRPEPPPPPPPPPRLAAAPAPSPAPPAAPPAAVAPPSLAPAATSAPRPAAEPTPATAPSAAPYPGRFGGIEVSLASVRTPDEARAEWARLKRDNADLLGRLSAFAVRTDLGDKGIYYRVEAGPFADVTAAEHLCRELQRRNFGCLIAR
jgi:outer membrane biosynthesis protein TonB